MTLTLEVPLNVLSSNYLWHVSSFEHCLQSMSLSTMQGRYRISVSAFCSLTVCSGSSDEAEFSHWFSEKKRAYTTTTERKSFGELFWPQRKTFQAGGGYKNPIRPGKPCPPPKSFLCGPHFFLQREVLHWSRAV